MITSSVANRLHRGALAVLLTGSLAALDGCALGPNPRDPFEPFNRKMMQLNEGVDAVALKPAAIIYKDVVPPLVRTGVRNFFGNLSDAWSVVNSLLQFRLHDAADNFARVQINTLVGLGGIFDVASEFHIERHHEDFGQTLGRWGVPAGPYLMLPLLGPSTVRDTFALPVDRKADPLHDVDPWTSRGSLYILRAVDARSNLLRASSVLDQAALDKYTFTRDAHLQRRRAQIFDRDNTDSAAGQEPKIDGQSAPAPAPRPENDGSAPAAPEPAR
jgi:phospholipid-binding lipoprotein MlaA